MTIVLFIEYFSQQLCEWLCDYICYVLILLLSPNARLDYPLSEATFLLLQIPLSFSLLLLSYFSVSVTGQIESSLAFAMAALSVVSLTASWFLAPVAFSPFILVSIPPSVRFIMAHPKV